jgi:hypothetical protein
MGRLPQASASGNNYLLVAYDYDSNSILLRPIKNRTADAITEAIKSVHDTLAKGGCQPKFHRLDNECKHPQTTTGAMQQREPYELRRITWLPGGTRRTTCSRCTFGTKLSHKQSYHSTYCEGPESTPNCQRGNRSTGGMSSMPTQSPHQASKYWHIPNQRADKHGPPMPMKHGMWAQQWTTTDVIQCGPQPRARSES